MMKAKNLVAELGIHLARKNEIISHKSAKYSQMILYIQSILVITKKYEFD